MMKRNVLLILALCFSFCLLWAEPLTKENAEKNIDSFFSGEGTFVKVMPAQEYIYYFNKSRIDQILVTSVGLSIVHDGEKFTFVYERMIPTQYVNDIYLDKKGNLILQYVQRN